MAKMSELDLCINELRAAAQSLTNAADSLTALFGQPTETDNAPAQEKPKPPTLEKVRGVLADKSRNGHTEAVRILLEKYGGNKLSEISPDRYAELLKDAEGLND